ncbi:transposable element Tcb2 transposase [Trichonephila clavipes]|nr:transposable element Tcb2 transposase [Trichonephila clavipes]
MSQVRMDREARVPRYWPKSCRWRECVPTDMVYNKSFYDPPNISPIAPKKWHVKILYNGVRAHRCRKGIVQQHAVEPGTTVNGSYYANVLRTVIQHVKGKRPLLRNFFLLHHDNCPTTYCSLRSTGCFVVQNNVKRVENRFWSDQEDHEERGSKDRAASTCGPHSDSFNDTSRRRRSNCSTISRHLAEANLKSKRPFRALPLIPEHRQLRLQWCQARSMWNVTYWQKVVFSDESRFVLGTDDNRVRVWRRPGERYNSPHTVLRHTARTAGIMVWGAIACDSRSTLILMRGTLTGQRYVDDILRPHTSPWPARSPDLSPVEQVWDQLKRQMPSCHSVHDLELAVQDLWAHLPQDNIRCLINSLPDRVAARIAAGDGRTRY